MSMKEGNKAMEKVNLLLIAAQKKVAGEIGNAVFVPTTDIEQMFDNWHYTPASEWELGMRLVRAIIK